MEHNLSIQTINKMYAFACKYRDLYSDPETTLEDLTSSFESECIKLGFDHEDTSYEPYEVGHSIYSKWNEVMHSDSDLLSKENREWFQKAFTYLAKITEGLLILKEPLQKFILTSNVFSYGPLPQEGEEVQQKLSVSDNGSVWLTRYTFSRKDNDTHYKVKEKILSDPETNKRILDAMKHTLEEYKYDPVLDAGYWNIDVTNTDGKTIKLSGSLFSYSLPELSDYIREQLNRNDLFLFDGAPDRIEQIKIIYDRHTEIKNAHPSDSDTPYDIWNYHEEVTIDRSTETIDHYRKIMDECDIHSVYHVAFGVSHFLDNMDVDMLSDIEGNPEDVYVNPHKTSTYKILVTTRTSGIKEMTGTFDKNGLPVHYPSFIDDLYEFLAFYGMGEIFDENIYGKPRRRIHDLIFCNVIFEEGGREYCYLSDTDYDPGDLVIVPAGEDDHEAVVKVKSVEYHPAGKAPYPLDKIKHVIRPYDEDEDAYLLDE